MSVFHVSFLSFCANVYKESIQKNLSTVGARVNNKSRAAKEKIKTIIILTHTHKTHTGTKQKFVLQYSTTNTNVLHMIMSTFGTFYIIIIILKARVLRKTDFFTEIYFFFLFDMFHN